VILNFNRNLFDVQYKCSHTYRDEERVKTSVHYIKFHCQRHATCFSATHRRNTVQQHRRRAQRYS